MLRQLRPLGGALSEAVARLEHNIVQQCRVLSNAAASTVSKVLDSTSWSLSVIQILQGQAVVRTQ